MVEVRDVYDKVFDLTSTRDLIAIQDMCRRPDKYKFAVDETILLPFRHVRYSRLKNIDGKEFWEVHDEVFDVNDTRDASEIEFMVQRPAEFRILVDERIDIPHRHIRFEILRG